MMDSRMDVPDIGEILVEEFMEPCGISAYRLAKEIFVPVSRIQDIIKGRRKITVDTSLRLAKYFDVSDRYFLDIQDDIDIRNAKVELFVEIQSIKKCDFLCEIEIPMVEEKPKKKRIAQKKA